MKNKKKENVTSSHICIEKTKFVQYYPAMRGLGLTALKNP
jgi:hypothetical protein